MHADHQPDEAILDSVRLLVERGELTTARSRTM